MTDLQSVKEKLYSEVWEESLGAADNLAEAHSDEAIAVLIEALNSNDNFIRNAASLGIREANSPVASNALLERIKQLGPNEEIGTMVYSLETADCSKNLLYIINLYLEGNYETQCSAKAILEDQEFQVLPNEFQIIIQRLNHAGTTVEELEIKYTINEA